MKTIKTLNRDGFTLEHARYIDSMGFPQDFFEMVKVQNDGARVRMPFFPPLKIHNYKRTDPIQTINDYTDEEYQTMFVDHIKKFNEHYLTS